jgi:hypothetical protein
MEKQNTDKQDFSPNMANKSSKCMEKTMIIFSGDQDPNAT